MVGVFAWLIRLVFVFAWYVGLACGLVLFVSWLCYVYGCVLVLSCL